MDLEKAYIKKQNIFRKKILKETDQLDVLKEIKLEDIPIGITFGNKIIYITGEITDELSKFVHQRLAQLNITDEEPLAIYIDTPGGSVSAMFAIIDSILMTTPNVVGIVAGLAGSAGGVIASYMPTRLIFPNATLMFHDFQLDLTSELSKVKSMSKYLEMQKDKCVHRVHELTQLPHKEISELFQNEWWLSPKEAVALGIMDAVVEEIEWQVSPLLHTTTTQTTEQISVPQHFPGGMDDSFVSHQKVSKSFPRSNQQSKYQSHSLIHCRGRVNQPST